jgi:hypothetical protein
LLKSLKLKIRKKKYNISSGIKTNRFKPLERAGFVFFDFFAKNQKKQIQRSPPPLSWRENLLIFNGFIAISSSWLVL